MLLAHLRRVMPVVGERPDELVISDLELFYVEAKARFDADEKFKEESREAVVALQRGDATTRRIWQAFCNESLRHCHAIYDRLGVRLIDRGESFYNDLMNEVVRRLEKLRESGANAAVRDSDGALCIFLDGYTTREGEPLPLMVRKSDGLQLRHSDSHRASRRGAEGDAIVYVVGLAQKQHFEMVLRRKEGSAGRIRCPPRPGFGNIVSKAARPSIAQGGTVKPRTCWMRLLMRAAWSKVEPDEARVQRSNASADGHIAETWGWGR
jgi:arginyl-tRNA synthetase